MSEQENFDTLESTILAGNPKKTMELLKLGFIIGPATVELLLKEIRDYGDAEIEHLAKEIQTFVTALKENKPLSFETLHTMPLNQKNNPFNSITEINNRVLKILEKWEPKNNSGPIIHTAQELYAAYQSQNLEEFETKLEASSPNSPKIANAHGDPNENLTLHMGISTAKIKTLTFPFSKKDFETELHNLEIETNEAYREIEGNLNGKLKLLYALSEMAVNCPELKDAITTRYELTEKDFNRLQKSLESNIRDSQIQQKLTPAPKL